MKNNSETSRYTIVMLSKTLENIRIYAFKNKLKVSEAVRVLLEKGLKS